MNNKNYASGLKLFKNRCIEGWERGAESDLSKEEKQKIKKEAELICECRTQKLQLVYPNPRELPPSFSRQIEDINKIAEECLKEFEDNLNQ